MKNKARPERFELPTLWFEGGDSCVGTFVLNSLGRPAGLFRVQFGTVWVRLCKGLCKTWPLRIRHLMRANIFNSD